VGEVDWGVGSIDSIVAMGGSAEFAGSVVGTAVSGSVGMGEDWGMGVGAAVLVGSSVWSGFCWQAANRKARQIKRRRFGNCINPFYQTLPF
jgi:hypothetical protein